MRFSMLTYRTILFLLAFLCTTPMTGAEVPRETVERLVEIKVEIEKLRHLNNIGKISGGENYRLSGALQTEATGLWEPYKRSLQPEALATIEGLTRAKFALLAPQWQKEAEEARQAKREQQKQTALDLEQDARRAVEFQRQRHVLQGQLNGGAIDQDSYAQKDRAALAGITDLRKKYETAGGTWPIQFDQRLDRLTKAYIDNPTAALPQPQEKAGAGEGTAAGQTPQDFNHDVQRAAAILIKEQENTFKFNHQEISPDTHRDMATVSTRDLAQLRARYRSVSPQRLHEFQSAYAKIAAPAIQVLRVKYYPDKYIPLPPNKDAIILPKRPPYQYVPPVPDTPQYGAWIFWGVIIFGGFGLLVWFSGSKEEPVPEKPITSTTYGSAEWQMPYTEVFNPVTTAKGVMFGKSSHPTFRYKGGIGAPVVSKPEVHTLIVARTRAGKGTRVIIPTLLRYDSSMLIIDPKGENAAITARTRRDHLFQTVHIVNPWGELEAHYKKLGFTRATYNPLDAINRHDPNAVAVAQSLAATICPITDPKERFWQGSAANVLAAVFLWITDSPTEEKTLARARHIVTRSRADFKKILVQMIASEAFNGAISEMVSPYIDLADDTYSGIMSGLVENTKFISDLQIKTSTASSSFSMQGFRDKRITVYIVIPHDRIETHSTWLRLIIASAMQALKARNRNPAPPKHRCMFMIDEFGSIGHIPDLPRDIALMSGYGLDFTLIVQGLDQLEHHYNKAKGTILNNCGYKWFCYVGDLETAKYLSESLGKATVKTKSTSFSSGTSGERETSGENTSYGETGRELLTPSEILTLGRDKAILLSPDSPPSFLEPVDYWRLAEEFEHLSDNYPLLYSIPELTFDRNPYRQD